MLISNYDKFKKRKRHINRTRTITIKIIHATL